MSAAKTVGIVGGGLAGCVLGMFLSRRGHRVAIFEKHRRPAAGEIPPSGRSINLTLTKRGLDALDKVGAAPAAISASAPASERIMHLPGGAAVSRKYDETNHALHSISRARLNLLLLERLEREFDVALEFGARIAGVDVEAGEIVVKEKGARRFDAVIGADGTFSTVRLALQKRPGFDFMQEFSAHANIELRVPAGSGWRGRGGALHVWPRKDSLLIAFPGSDGSWALTLQLPVEGPLSARELVRVERVPEFFSVSFPEIAPFVADPAGAVRNNLATRMVSIRCGRWFAEKACLIGDAAHAVFPSYGQGANAAFEDCLILDEMLERTGDDFAEAFRSFYYARKPATDALCDLSREHAQRLRLGGEDDDRRRRLREALRRACPAIGHSLYANIAFTRMPYNVASQTERAVERALDQLTMLDGLGVEFERSLKGG